MYIYVYEMSIPEGSKPHIHNSTTRGKKRSTDREQSCTEVSLVLVCVGRLIKLPPRLDHAHPN
jgi:hypothetical protein